MLTRAYDADPLHNLHRYESNKLAPGAGAATMFIVYEAIMIHSFPHPICSHSHAKNSR